MMPYMDPAATCLPYQSDPSDRSGNTSRQGAHAISDDARSIRARYVRWLYGRGAFGATDLEASTVLGISRTTIIPRRHELAEHVRWTGEKRAHRVKGRLVENKVYALAVFVPQGTNSRL